MQASMKQLADDVYILEGFPPYAINVYLLGDVLVDAATRFAASRILRRLRGTKCFVARAHACAPRPSGSEPCDLRAAGNSSLVRRRRRRRDGDARRDHGAHAAALALGVGRALWTGPPHPVARRLREGDRVGRSPSSRRPATPPAMSRSGVKRTACWYSATSLPTSISYTGWVMLRDPKRFFTLDPAQNRRSARRLVALEPKLICFGHGPPLRDTGDLSIS